MSNLTTSICLPWLFRTTSAKLSKNMNSFAIQLEKIYIHILIIMTKKEGSVILNVPKALQINTALRLGTTQKAPIITQLNTCGAALNPFQLGLVD